MITTKKGLLKIVGIICLFHLSSCALLVGAGAGGATASVLNDKRTLTQIRDDSTIAYQIEQKLYESDALTRHSSISAYAFNYVVLLVGEAQDAQQREYADKIAQNEPQVRRVYNEITISPGTTVLSGANDKWLTMKVYTEMLAKKGLKTAPIKVVTSDAVVYLIGNVSQEQAKLATDVAKQISGVQRVVTIFDDLPATK